MAGAFCQLDFLTQVKNARVEIASNFSRLIQNVNLLRNELLEEIQELKNEYLREVQRVDELKRLTQHLTSTVTRSLIDSRVTSITDQIQNILSEKNSKLLVLDWDTSTEQILINKFCKISVKNQPSSSPDETLALAQSMYQLNISGHDTSPVYHHLPDVNSSSSEECHVIQTSLTLEQKYKRISDPTSTSCSKDYAMVELQTPKGVSIDDNTDEIYVVDSDYHCILVFERDGSYIRQFTHNRMIQPVGIYVSCNLDRVYVTVCGRHAVHCYKLNGIFIKEITCYGASSADINNPAGITMDDNERVYVCVRGRDRVAVFTKYLMFITVLTSQLSDPRDVKVVDSEVAVLHDGEYCVSFYTRGGVFLRKVVKKGNNKQKIGKPSFFCIDSDNNILITDSKQNCIKIYRSTGFHICNIACEGESDDDDEYVYPAGISLFDDGSIVSLCDRNEDQLQVFEI